MSMSLISRGVDTTHNSNTCCPYAEKVNSHAIIIVVKPWTAHAVISSIGRDVFNAIDITMLL